MPPLTNIIAGPWRAVLVLGVTEILAWGAIFYPPVLTVPLISHARRRFCLDGELARDPFFDRGRRMARHLSRLRRAPCSGRGAAARLRLAAHAREARGAARPRGASAERGPAADRLAVPAGRGGLRRLRLRAVGPVRAPARDLRPPRHGRGDRGGDFRAVSARAGRAAHLLVAVRAQ